MSCQHWHSHRCASAVPPSCGGAFDQRCIVPTTTKSMHAEDICMFDMFASSPYCCLYAYVSVEACYAREACTPCRVALRLVHCPAWGSEDGGLGSRCWLALHVYTHAGLLCTACCVISFGLASVQSMPAQRNEAKVSSTACLAYSPCIPYAMNRGLPACSMHCMMHRRIMRCRSCTRNITREAHSAHPMPPCVALLCALSD